MKHKLFKKSDVKIGALLLAVAGLLSHLLGVGRDIALSHFFGASEATDAYGTAFLFPDLIFNLVIASTLTGVFLPVFSKEVNKNKEKAEKMAGAFITFTFLLALTLCTLMYFLIPFIVTFFYADFSPEKSLMTIELSRILLLSPLLFLWGNFLGSVLLSQKHFFSYAFSPVLYNLGIILGIVFFYEKSGIYAAAYGVLIGLLFYVALRVFDFFSLDISPKLNLEISRIKDIFRLAAPRALSLFLFHINFWVYAALSSGLAEGSFAVFNFARNIETFPVSIFGVSIATASLPFLSDFFAKNKLKEFALRVEKAAGQILFFAIPSSVGIACLSQLIVDILFCHGEFDSQAALATSQILLFLAISIPFESLGHIFAQSFYAQGNTIKPLLSSAVLTASSICLSVILSRSIGSVAFGISFSVAVVFKVVLLGFLLRKKVNFSLKKIFLSGAKIYLLSALMAAFLLPLVNWISPELSLTSKIFFLVVLVASGGAIYLVLSFISGKENGIFRRYFPGKK